MKGDLDIAKIEKEIEKKYGKIATINPRSLWDEAKEARYLKEVKKRKISQASDEKVSISGFEVTKRLLDRPSRSRCEYCGKYNLSLRDEVKLREYGCCFGCYVQHVESREERWKSGWRPNKQNFPKE